MADKPNPFVKRDVSQIVHEEGDTMQDQRRPISELLKAAGGEPIPPDVSPQAYAPKKPAAPSITPEQRAAREDMFDELKQALDTVQDTDAELRRLSSIIYHLRYDQLKTFSTEVGSTVDKVHDWASKIVKTSKQENEEAK